MKGKKNDFSISYYYGAERVLFLEYVHDTNKATYWVNSKGIQWTHYAIYNRRTREFIEVIYNERYPVYSLSFFDKNGQNVYVMRNVWDYSSAFDYVTRLGISFEYANVHDFFTRQFIERIYL